MGYDKGLSEHLAHYRVPAVVGEHGLRDVPDDTGCGVLHIDMDAFFAAVELRTRPELARQPVVVAGQGPRSVVLSANYPAREFGVGSAMPVARARRLCPHATYLPPTRERYSEVSAGIMSIFRDVTPQVEPLSLDEAFLDVRGALRRLNSTPAGVAERIRSRVAAEHGITCSVGVAPAKFLAKLASGMAKPDGAVVVPAGQVREFLEPLPASSLSGVGPRTADSLERVGVHTIGDLTGTELRRLKRAIGAGAAEHVHALAMGYDPRPVVADAVDKSIGAERTFDVDQADHAVLSRELLQLAEQVATGMRSKGLLGRTVSIKVRFADFTTITRSRSLPTATDVAQEIHTCAMGLLTECTGDSPSVRLIGTRVEGLRPAAGGQLSLADEESPRREVEIAADGARTKFGASAVRPASLLSWQTYQDDD